MDFHDWEAFLSKKNNNIRNLNGHFVIVEWEPGSLRIRNDQLGMRDMFITETNDYFTFSTRLDWLVHFIDNPELDFTAYGSAWLYVNSYSYDCFIKCVQRLGQGGTARFDDENFTLTNDPWLPEYAPEIPNLNGYELIQEFSTLALRQNEQLLFGLSGGLDSRVLLSILLRQNGQKWRAYTYGEKEFPDAVIAARLASKFGIDHDVISDLIPYKKEEIEKFTEFVLQTNSYVNGYFFYEQNHYNHLNNKFLLIDGGKGAFCRRNHAKYLWLRGRNHIINGDPENVLKYIMLNKPKIFQPDILNEMEQSSINEIDNIFHSMPDISEISCGNWVDIFTVRYHCANAGSPTQSRLDGIIRNYMPFLQPSFLRKLFSFSVSFRAQNKFYRKVLHKGDARLKYFPLVKDMSIIPFTFNTYLTYIMGKLFERFQRFQTNDYPKLFLTNNREYVMDTMESKEIREYPHYDYHMIQNMVQGYYSGQNNNAKGVLWWLTFDVWRKKLQNSQKIT